MTQPQRPSPELVRTRRFPARTRTHCRLPKPKLWLAMRGRSKRNLHVCWRCQFLDYRMRLDSCAAVARRFLQTLGGSRYASHWTRSRPMYAGPVWISIQGTSRGWVSQCDSCMSERLSHEVAHLGVSLGEFLA